MLDLSRPCQVKSPESEIYEAALCQPLLCLSENPFAISPVVWCLICVVTARSNWKKGLLRWDQEGKGNNMTFISLQQNGNE